MPQLQIKPWHPREETQEHSQTKTHTLTLCNIETPKRALLQTVKTQMNGLSQVNCIARTQWDHRATFRVPAMLAPCQWSSYYDLLTLPLRPWCSYYTLTTFLLRPDLATSSLNMFKVRPHPSHPWRPYYAHIGFYYAPTSSYLVHSIFQGGSKNVAECEGGIREMAAKLERTNLHPRFCCFEST